MASKSIQPQYDCLTWPEGNDLLLQCLPTLFNLFPTFKFERIKELKLRYVNFNFAQSRHFYDIVIILHPQNIVIITSLKFSLISGFLDVCNVFFKISLSTLNVDVGNSSNSFLTFNLKAQNFVCWINTILFMNL